MNGRLKSIYLFSIAAPLLGTSFTHGAEVDAKVSSDPQAEQAKAFFTGLKARRFGGYNNGTTTDAIKYGGILVTKVTTGEEENQRLQEKIDKNDSCCKQLTYLKNKLKEKEKEIALLEEVKKEQADESPFAQADENPALQSKIDKLKEERTRLESQLAEAKIDLENNNSKIDQCRKQCKELEKKVASGKSTTQQLEDRLTFYRSELHKARAKHPYSPKALIEKGAFISLKSVLKNGIKAHAPRSAPTVLGVPIGNAEQTSEFLGHALFEIYDHNMELSDLQDPDTLMQVGTSGLKAFTRELGLTVLMKAGDKTGINQKLDLAYQKSGLAGFLERHTTTREAVKVLAFLGSGAARIAADALLEEYVYSSKRRD